MNKQLVTLVAVAACASGALAAERIFRPQRVARGETAQARLALFDSAAWITHADLKDELAPKTFRVVRFRKAFTLQDGAKPLDIDVSADERFYLTCDGAFVGRGPHRGTVDNWMFQSYRLDLKPGKHVMEAVVWKHSDGNAPRAQLSWRFGFALAASAPYEKDLTTGVAAWEAGIVEGVKENGMEGGPWGAGSQDKSVGAGIYDLQPAVWKKTVVVRDAIPPKAFGWGSRCHGWQAYPSQLKDQTEYRVLPGEFVVGDLKAPKTFAPNTVTTNYWDLGRYICAYPELTVSGGKGATVKWYWSESLVDDKDRLKHDRREWKGKHMDGFGDTFVSDGRDRAVFSSSWFRCGRWCRIIVETKDEPLTVKDLALIESRYPLECESEFVAPDLKDADAIQAICARGIQMCAHEMLFDCPYYEQQMYPGDTRLQLNIISAMTADDALVRRAIEFYDLARFNDGLVPFNFPTWGNQEGLTYTLCYLLMHPDYLMNHANRAWFKARLPGYRNTLSGVEYYESENGLLDDIPGWSFMDWPKAEGWNFGNPPGAIVRKANGQINGFWLLAMRGAEKVEKALGNPEIAAYWHRKAEKTAAACRATFWDESRGLFADDPEKKHFSEHTQAMMLLSDCITGEQAKRCFERLVTDQSLVRTTVYFKYYLFETFFKFSRPDLFLKDMDLWRSYLALGCTTCIEEPEFPGKSARSDCHAWGSHPLFFFRARVAGIASDAPFFEKVRVAPQPGPLSSVKASWPHPSGKMIEVDLKFDGGNVSGKIITPVPGVFVWQGREVPLRSGRETKI